MEQEQIELVSNADIPESVRKAIAERYFTQSDIEAQCKIEMEKIASERRRIMWNTPVVAALAGMITLGATFVFDKMTADNTTENTITLEQVRKELELSEARLKQELDAASEENLARLQAKAKEREFQYEIVRSELTNASKSNAERASVLLFLVRAGVLSSLNEEQLSAMAEEQRQRPDETIIPSLSSTKAGGSRFDVFGAGRPFRIYGDWAVFMPRAGERCLIGSNPATVLNSRDGRVVAVRRGDLFLSVNRELSADKTDEIAFAAGYPIGQYAKLTVGTQDFTLNFEGEFAYPLSIEENEQILSLFASSKLATFVTLSSRGTLTTDEYSLDGFSEALSSMKSLCPD